MDNLKSVFEELKKQKKDYPENNIEHPLAPTEYIDSLIHYIAKQTGDKFEQLYTSSNIDEILNLTSKITEIIHPHTESLHLPLSSILYRHDDKQLPINKELYLSKLDFISNDQKENQNFFKSLKFEILTSDSIDFMVSFIRWSGLQLLIKPLQELERQGKKVRILTSFYLNITEAKALKKLLEFSNVEVKIFDSGHDSFHTKAYLFHRCSNLNTIIIGSSNLSQAALKSGHEWNVKIPDTTYLPIYHKAKKSFNLMWDSSHAVPLNNDLLSKYEAFLQNRKTDLSGSFNISKVAEQQNEYTHTGISPNNMQKNALHALSQTRKSGKTKGVVIAATGTGKTYLSAFDVKNFNPKRILFLAHREELLQSAKHTFEKVFGNAARCGLLTGTKKEFDSPFLFSTVQTLSSDETLSNFSRNSFDYIIVDEFHHAEAQTYRKILDYFNPDFLLGLTATPERLDGKDVLAICDHNVVYEIRLRDALEAELLAPFHYFGVSDDTINYNDISLTNGLYNENLLVRALKNEERVDYIINMMNLYGYSGNSLICLGFCTNIDHAKYMSEEFNKRGYYTTYLTGNDSPDTRRQVIERLEDETDMLQIIFTVDIFNEGIDIPKLNMVLFLRPTESPTIFIQQLGRGLRKSDNKEFVTILDFIGNHQKSFIVPLALSGQHNHKAFDKDSLRIAVQQEFADLPGGSYVDLDIITQKRILDKIDSIRMDAIAMLKDIYNQFKKDIGRSPSIADFLYIEEAPNLQFFINKFKSWLKTKEKMNDLTSEDQKLLQNNYAIEICERLENMYPLKWPYEFIILGLALKQNCIAITDVLKELENQFNVATNCETHKDLILRAMSKLTEPYQKQKWSFGHIKNETFIIPLELQSILKENKTAIQERIEYGLIEYRRTYQPTQFLQQGERLIRYQNYTRNDLIFLFNAAVQEGTWREGVSRVHNHYLLFINLNKDEKIEDHLHYHDYFIDPGHFHWQSQNQTSHGSERGKDYIYHKEKDIHIHLFVRKFNQMHGMTLPFVYLGKVDYVSSHNDKPMNIKWKLHHPVPNNLFTDFIR